MFRSNEFSKRKIQVMRKYILCALSGLLLASCIDTQILPDDMIVEEDYWKTREDVSMMVAGAYKAMASSDVIQRFIVWGSARSDELNPTTSITINGNSTYNNLQEMNTGNMDYQNVYANWASLYTVINRCNQVLEKAPQVMQLDPSYTEATYLTDKSQMLALRSLAYFYLVRAFRDVPYVTTAYFNSGQDMLVKQVAPATVLENCIADLQEALKAPLSSTGYSDWRRCGLITRDAINALLADIHLWRASMTHNAADYQSCVDYCQAVIQSKQAAYPKDPASGNDSEYPLIKGDDSYYQIFSKGNSQESIFELQMNSSRAGYNTGLSTMYWSYEKNRTAGFLEPASGIFGAAASDDKVFLTANDYRFYESCFDVGSGTEGASLTVRKMLYYMMGSQTTLPDARKLGKSSGLNRSGDNYSEMTQNWIVYRLTDVMLMEAEALVQLASGSGDVKLGQAFNLVKAVNDRSIAEASLATDSLKFADYSSVEDMETLVLSERMRELCFEGKRWFDLMRYNYRHVEGVDITKTMSEILGKATVSSYPVTNYSEMLVLMTRKYTEGGNTVRYKISREPMLYFPVYESEMQVNSNLKQNPAYDTQDSYNRN